MTRYVVTDRMSMLPSLRSLVSISRGAPNSAPAAKAASIASLPPRWATLFSMHRGSYASSNAHSTWRKSRISDLTQYNGRFLAWHLTFPSLRQSMYPPLSMVGSTFCLIQSKSSWLPCESSWQPNQCMASMWVRGTLLEKGPNGSNETLVCRSYEEWQQRMLCLFRDPAKVADECPCQSQHEGRVCAVCDVLRPD